MRWAARPSRNSRSPRGFTLVEVLVTLTIMGIILPVAMRAISTSIMVASTAQRKAEATMLGQAKLNEIVSDMKLGDYSTAGSTGDFGAEWPGYSWSSQTYDDTDLLVTYITLTVNWSQRGQPRSLNFSTLVLSPV